MTATASAGGSSDARAAPRATWEIDVTMHLMRRS